MLDWVPDAVAVCDATGRMVYVNRQLADLSGYERSELLGRTVELLVPAPLRPAHRRLRAASAEKGRGPRPMGASDRDFRLRRKDGTEVSVDIALDTIRDRGRELTLAAVRDFTAHRTLEATLAHQALHDPLTGLANRTLFFDRIEQAISGARREQGSFALVMVDLDRFKNVNDAHGHAVGDEVLRQLGARLAAGLRATDTAARLGGDEFALILPRIAGRQAAGRLARRHLGNLRVECAVGRRRIVSTASAGVALYPRDGSDVDSLLRHADSAMYLAKREGIGVAFYPSTAGAGG